MGNSYDSNNQIRILESASRWSSTQVGAGMFGNQGGRLTRVRI